MPGLTFRRISLLAAASLVTFAAGIAQADVTLREHMAVEGEGLMSFANMSGTSTTSVSGKNARTESDLVMESKLVRMFARGAGQTTEIVRLGDDKVYEINTPKKTYSETSLTERRAQLQKAADQAKETQAKQPAPTGMDEQDCEWSEPTAEVNRTGQKATIAGFAAEQVTLVTKQSCKNKKTGAVCDVALYLDEWLAPSFDGGDEVQKYRIAYAQQMGLSSAAATDRAEALFGRYKAAWAKVTDKMKGLKGYPVKSSFSMGFGGPQCQNPSSTSQSTADSSGSSSGSAMPGGLAGQIAGSLFGGRKKKAQQEEAAASTTPAAPAPAALNGMVTPIKVTSELLSVSKDSLSADTFQPPAGFKKVTQ
jgi:hypothetical protein